MVVETMTPSDVKETRESLDMTQREMASIMGVSCALVARWETGSLVVSKSHERLVECLRESPGERKESDAWRKLISDGRSKDAFLFLCLGRSPKTLEKI